MERLARSDLTGERPKGGAMLSGWKPVRQIRLPTHGRPHPLGVASCKRIARATRLQRSRSGGICTPSGFDTEWTYVP